MNACLSVYTVSQEQFHTLYCTVQAEGVLLPKSQREEEFYFAPRSKTKAKGNKGNKEKSKTIKYDVGTLAYFDQCGVRGAVSPLSRKTF